MSRPTQLSLEYLFSFSYNSIFRFYSIPDTCTCYSLLHCALSLAAQSIVIGVFCLWACSWVCYHDNSKLHASIFIKLFIGKGSDHLQLIKFWPSPAPRKGLRRGENFWFRLTTASAQCLRLSERFFHFFISSQ